jgi:hypothetical protein
MIVRAAGRPVLERIAQERCPFPALWTQQTSAVNSKPRHKAKAKISRLSDAECTIRQLRAKSRKARLTLLVPPVNRRVVGSSPT